MFKYVQTDSMDIVLPQLFGINSFSHTQPRCNNSDHHKAEASFKALALALRQAVSGSGFGDIASTKGTLEGAAS